MAQAKATLGTVKLAWDQEARTALEAQYNELVQVIDIQEKSFQSLATEARTFAKEYDNFAAKLDCEVRMGCVSLMRGTAAVAATLIRIKDAYGTAGANFDKLQTSHDSIMNNLTDLNREVGHDIATKVDLEILIEGTKKLRAKSGDFMNVKLAPVISDLISELVEPWPRQYSQDPTTAAFPGHSRRRLESPCRSLESGH